VSQNELLVANTLVTVIACSVGFGSYIAGLFGMNLDQTFWLQPEKGSFYGVCFISFAFMIMSVLIVMRYLHSRNILPTKMSLREFKQVQETAKVVPLDSLLPFFSQFIVSTPR
jgi:uncharacterized membrane protein